MVHTFQRLDWSGEAFRHAPSATVELTKICTSRSSSTTQGSLQIFRRFLPSKCNLLVKASKNGTQVKAPSAGPASCQVMSGRGKTLLQCSDDQKTSDPKPTKKEVRPEGYSAPAAPAAPSSLCSSQGSEAMQVKIKPQRNHCHIADNFLFTLSNVV